MRLSENKKSSQANLRRSGGGGWIRTTEARRNRFTVCPLWPLGNSSIFTWSWWTDSNPRPADYKSAALPTELHQRIAHPQQRIVFYQTKGGLSIVFCTYFENVFLKIHFFYYGTARRSGRWTTVLDAEGRFMPLEQWIGTKIRLFVRPVRTGKNE